MALSSHAKFLEKGNVQIDSDGKVLTFAEKPPGSNKNAFVNAGVYVFHRSALLHDAWTIKCSLEKDVFPRLATDSRLYGMVMQGTFSDIGLPEEYLEFKGP